VTVQGKLKRRACEASFISAPTEETESYYVHRTRLGRWAIDQLERAEKVHLADIDAVVTKDGVGCCEMEDADHVASGLEPLSSPARLGFAS
jgi:hypothetical protein